MRTQSPNASLVAIAAVVGLLSACGRPIFYAEVEEKKVCETLYGIPFPPTPPGSDLQQQIDLPIGNLTGLFGGGDGGIDLTTFKPDIRLVEVDFNAGQGIVDFNQFDSATLKVLAPADAGVSDTTLLTYTKDPAHLPGRTMIAASPSNTNTQTNLLPYFNGGNVSLQASMTGTLPNNVWTTDIRGCLYLKVRVNYLNKYGL